LNIQDKRVNRLRIQSVSAVKHKRREIVLFVEVDVSHTQHLLATAKVALNRKVSAKVELTIVFEKAPETSVGISDQLAERFFNLRCQHCHFFCSFSNPAYSNKLGIEIFH
jgi:hypothetical protein